MKDRKTLSVSYHVSRDVIGKVLAHAFVLSRKAELKLRVMGNAMVDKNEEADNHRLNVVVDGGVVKKSWIG